MKRFVNPLLSLSAPLLVLISLIGFTQRDGSSRLQPLLAFLVGTGLIISGAMVRRYRRQRLLRAIQESNNQEDGSFV